MAAEIPAGWYPNPWNDAEELYWSGVEWTGISRAAHRVAPQQGMPEASADVEDSTVMRPVGPAAAALHAPPVVAPPSDAPPPAPQQGPNPFGPPAYAPPAYGPPTYAPEYSAPQYGADNSTPPYAPAYSARQYAPPPAPPHTDEPDATSIRWALSAGTPPQPAVNPRAKFGLIAMIVGIVAAVFAVIPGLSFAAWIPAFVAIAFGIVGYLGGRPRAFALTGIIAGGAALAVGTAVSIWFLTQLGVLAG